MNGGRIYQFKALTDLWTGSVSLGEKNGQIEEKLGPERLVTTGLLGSIRWWFEVLVRGLGGYACDPSDSVGRCPDKTGDHCVVCELFGCTGWARKFRFEVLDERGRNWTSQIKQDPRSVFSFRFTPLRAINPEEWSLLDLTLRLITDYGAVGGKTVFKPTDEPNRAGKIHHKDYGLVHMTAAPKFNALGRVDLKVHLSKWRKASHDASAWASLQHFWYVDGRYLSRQNHATSTFNRAIGRPEPKQQSGRNDSWVAGYRPDPRINRAAESKKVFSFKNPARTFGFVKPGLMDFSAMKQRLTGVWGQNGWDFLTGDKILNQLFAMKEERQ